MKELQKRVVDYLPCKELREAIKNTNHIFTELELLTLIWRKSPTLNQKLVDFQELSDKATRIAMIESPILLKIRLINELNDFKKSQEGVVFECLVYERECFFLEEKPQVRVIFSNYEDVENYIKLYRDWCIYSEDGTISQSDIDEANQVTYVVEKRHINPVCASLEDMNKNKDVLCHDHILGSCQINGEMDIVKVWTNSNFDPFNCCDGGNGWNCDECDMCQYKKAEMCPYEVIIRYPAYLNNLDLVQYQVYGKGYAIVFTKQYRTDGYDVLEPTMYTRKANLCQHIDEIVPYEDELDNVFFRSLFVNHEDIVKVDPETLCRGIVERRTKQSYFTYKQYVTDIIEGKKQLPKFD